MSIYIDLTGNKYNSLLVLGIGSRSNDNRIRWRCQCDCGNETLVLTSHLKNGNTKSCGCLQKKIVSDMFLKHGHSNDSTYKSWQAMKNRCTNSTTPDYKYYGGRGIILDNSWYNFQNFLKDMGEKPSLQHTIERIDNNKGYNKQNCKWATRLEQAQNTSFNRRFIFNGEDLTMSEIARRTNIPYDTLRHRINSQNMSIEMATSVKNRYRSKE